MTTTRMTIMIIVPKAPVVMEEMGVLVAPADAAATDHPAKAQTEVMEAMGVTEVPAVPVTLAKAAQEATVDPAETVDAEATGPLAEVAAEETEVMGVMEAKEVLQIEAPCHQVPARLQLGVQSLQVQPRTKTLRSRRTHPL